MKLNWDQYSALWCVLMMLKKFDVMRNSARLTISQQAYEKIVPPSRY